MRASLPVYFLCEVEPGKSSVPRCAWCGGRLELRGAKYFCPNCLRYIPPISVYFLFEVERYLLRGRRTDNCRRQAWAAASAQRARSLSARCTICSQPVINKSLLSANCGSAHWGMRRGRHAPVPGLLDLVRTESAQAQGLHPMRGVLDAVVAQVRGAGRRSARPAVSFVPVTTEAISCSQD